MEETDLYCIAYGCPKGNRSIDCPFSEIEHLPFKERIDWIDELDYEKKEAILKHHTYCTKKGNNTIST